MTASVAPVRAFVTGGASGIGAACVRRLVADGARVAIADISRDAAAELADELGDAAMACALDVTDPVSVDESMLAAISWLGGLDVAINSAGVGVAGLTDIAELEFDEWRRVIGIDLDGLFLSMRAEIRAMLDTGHGGSIVNIASVMGIVGTAGASAYVAAKHGVVGLTKAAALEYAARGIRVNAVGPGHVATPMFEKWPDSTRGEIIARYPMRRVATPEEVGDFACFIAGTKTGFATGAFYPLDGGYTVG